MKRIQSFCINHDVLRPGLYLSRKDGDVVTYDIRTRVPNAGDYMSNAAMHTVEHLMATYLRNSALSDAVLYFGPMGCRTGFYLLLRDTVSTDDAIALVRAGLGFVEHFEGEIPGSKRKECGNYLEHDLDGARKEAAAMGAVLADWKAENMIYPKGDDD